MSEKYKIISSIDKNLYIQGSPVIIAEGGLVRDIKKGNVFSQVRLINISNKTIMSVAIVSVTDFGRTDGGLHAQACVRDADMLINTPLVGYDHSVVKFEISEILFTDGSRWSPKDTLEWAVLPLPMTLEEYLRDHELANEFRSHFEDGVYYPYEEKDIWYCTCGALNHSDEGACHACNRTLVSLKKYGITELQNAVTKQKRLKAINRDAFDDAYRKVEADRRTKKNLRTLYIFIAIMVITLVIWLIMADGSHYTMAN